MDRRNFFKIVSTVSAGAATIALEKQKATLLIPLLVSDHEIIPGEEQWASVRLHVLRWRLWRHPARDAWRARD